METHLLRSKALSNIPATKAQERLHSIATNCETCSKKNLKFHEALDGLCSKCAITATVYNRYIESNIPIEYWDLKMEDFKGDARLLTKYNEIVSDLKDFFTSGKSICFMGLHGRGKTMVSSSILKKASQKGFNCLYTTLSDIVSTLTQAPGEDRYVARKELTMVDFLVIDEFDNRFMPTENAADLYARSLEGVIRTRLQNKLPTIMCTNSPNVKEAFNGALKSSIDSLMNKVEVFAVLGEDFRKKDAK